eukprot:5474916-Prymnesium_polylepis.1
MSASAGAEMMSADLTRKKSMRRIRNLTRCGTLPRGEIRSADLTRKACVEFGICEVRDPPGRGHDISRHPPTSR